MWGTLRFSMDKVVYHSKLCLLPLFQHCYHRLPKRRDTDIWFIYRTCRTPTLDSDIDGPPMDVSVCYSAPWWTEVKWYQFVNNVNWLLDWYFKFVFPCDYLLSYLILCIQKIITKYSTYIQNLIPFFVSRNIFILTENIKYHRLC